MKIFKIGFLNNTKAAWQTLKLRVANEIRHHQEKDEYIRFLQTEFSEAVPHTEKSFLQDLAQDIIRTKL